MAITTVSSFAFLLVDQLNEYHSYLDSQIKGLSYRASQPFALSSRTDLLTRTSDVVEQFCHSHSPIGNPSSQYSEQQLLAALYGFIPSIAPDLSVILQGNLPINSQYQAALIIIRGQEKVLFELRQNVARENITTLLVQAEQNMSANAIRYGILFCFSPHSDSYQIEERKIDRLKGRLRVFSA